MSDGVNDGFPWDILGIAPTKDRGAIRKAYSAKLKAMDVDSDVAGFEALREARSEALYLATQDDDADVQAEPQIGDFGSFAPSPAELDPIDASETKPALGIPPEEEQEDQPPPFTAPDELVAELFPNRERSEEPLTADEYERAHDAMQRIIAEARSAQVDKQTGIENWLASHLAESWPRSGPLVEEASAAFSWDKDAGRIDEDPAVAFINTRLELIRRLKEIEDPAHKYNDAWEELKKPGKRGRFDFGGPKKDKVFGLIEAIREEYPELETYLDAERVQSWIDPDTKGMPGWGFGIMVVAFVILTVLRIGSAIDDRPDAQEIIAESNARAEAPGWPSHDRQALVNELFGEGVNYFEVQYRAPLVFDILQMGTRGDLPTDEGIALVLANARKILRNRTQLSDNSVSFEELWQIRQLQADMMLMARNQIDAAACISVTETGYLPEGVEPNTEFLETERRLFGRLYQAGIYENDPSTEGPDSARIPEDIAEAVIKKNRLSVKDYNTLLSGGGTEAARCNFRLTMLWEVLEKNSRSTEDLLKVL